MYYTEDGYLDIEKIIENDRSTFIFIVGARGIGKTFGILKYMLDRKNKFIYMRRTQTQVDMIKSEELNPFKSLRTELGDDYALCMKSINKNITGVYKAEKNDEGIEKASGSALAYVMALSTVSNIRGFDASDCDFLCYDEFISERHEKPLTSEGTAFLNAVETIGRNRELKGQKPLRVICLSNSSNLANPIFTELKLITACERMLNKGKDYLRLPERDVSIYILHDSPISKRKADTSLYRLAGDDSDFSQMSLKNDFNQEYFGQIKSLNLKEYKPLVKVGEICVYKHKSQRLWYVTDHASGEPEVYDSSDVELRRFANDYYYLKTAHLNRHVFFESYIQQVLFERYLKF